MAYGAGVAEQSHVLLSVLGAHRLMLGDHIFSLQLLDLGKRPCVKTIHNEKLSSGVKKTFDNYILMINPFAKLNNVFNSESDVFSAESADPSGTASNSIGALPSTSGKIHLTEKVKNHVKPYFQCSNGCKKLFYFILIKIIFNMLGCASKCSIVIGAHGVLEPLGGVKHLLLLSTKRYNK